ncbi:armadillo-type protein [Mycena alexandri]|uniref:Armadillo-type protein n=1 Tax=Mycena alexandri TaxID=1745969 RepID=A0AAD6RVS6_9AGAR|nr:armadillo-type protein [Mycena alexandri]
MLLPVLVLPASIPVPRMPRILSKLFNAAAKPVKAMLCLDETRAFITAKFLVLAELSERAKIEQNAFVLVEFLRVEGALFDELLRSPAAKVKKYACVFIGSLASHKSTRDTTFKLFGELCPQIAKQLRDQDLYVRDAALFALIKISISPDGVEAIMKAQALEPVANSLSSRRAEEREKACLLLKILGAQKSNISIICSLNLPMRLVFLTSTHTQSGNSDSNTAVCRNATLALWEICGSPEGARAVVEANALPPITKLLHSPDPLTRACGVSSCGTSGDGQRHSGCCLGVSAPPEPHQSLDGARAVADAHAPERIIVHLHSSDPEVCKLTCQIMGYLAKHLTTLPAVLAANPCTQLLVIISETNFELRQNALAALGQISRWPDGAIAMVEAQVTVKAAELLYDPHPKIRAAASHLLGNLAIHGTTVAAVVSIEPYTRLVSLMSDPNSELRRFALYALSKMSLHAESAQAVVEANTLHNFSTHLSSPVMDIRRSASRHEETLPWVISLDPCAQLVSMLTDVDIQVSRCAAGALASMSTWPDGAAAVNAAKALNGAAPLLNASTDPQMEQWIAQMLANLIRHGQATIAHEATSLGELTTTFDLDSSGQLVSETLRMRTSSDSAQGPQVPEVLQDLGQLLGSTPDQELASNMLSSLTDFMLTSLGDQDASRYLMPFRVMSIGSTYESLRKQGSRLIVALPGQDAGNFNVRPTHIIEALANILASEEAEADVRLGFCACWVLIQLVRYKSGSIPSQ